MRDELTHHGSHLSWFPIGDPHWPWAILDVVIYARGGIPRICSYVYGWREEGYLYWQYDICGVRYLSPAQEMINR